jgi:dienelactone hydrolase
MLTQTGPYAAGSRTMFLHDVSRPLDVCGGERRGVRTLVTELWYPVDPDLAANASRATYADYVFGDASVHRDLMTATTFQHLTPETVTAGVTRSHIEAAIGELFGRQRGSYLDAPLTTRGGPFPVLVASPGDAGSRHNLEIICEHLAGHGYVVIAPEHTGNSPFAQLGRDPWLDETRPSPQQADHIRLVEEITDSRGVYGARADFGQTYSPLRPSAERGEARRQLNDALEERVRDLGTAMDWLTGANARGPWAGRLLVDRAGLLGRSFGAATALLAARLDARFACAFAVAAPAWRDPLQGDPLQGDPNRAFLELRQPTFLLSGAEDDLLIGMAGSRAGAGPTPENPHPLLYEAFTRASAPILWGLLANGDHDSFTCAARYWWPALKPHQARRAFAPDETFTLIEPQQAQAVQRLTALAFFDRFLGMDKTALARLDPAALAAAGLTLEARNLEQASG